MQYFSFQSLDNSFKYIKQLLCCNYLLVQLTKCRHHSVQSLSRVRLFVTPWTAAHQASLSITNSQSLLKLLFITSVMPSNHLILCHPLLLWPSIFSNIKVFSSESVLRIKWPKYWSFSFSISPSKGYSELISFRMDWLDLRAVQETLKSLLQTHSSKASFLRLSESTKLSSLCYTETSHWLSILRMVVYMWSMLSPFVPPSSPPPTRHTSPFYTSVSIPALQIGSSVPFS